MVEAVHFLHRRPTAERPGSLVALNATHRGHRRASNTPNPGRHILDTVAAPFALVPDIAAEVSIPKDGIITRAVYQDDSTKAVIFGFSAGQELSEHTAAVPAIMHFLKGEARVTLGHESIEAHAGTWVHMQRGLAHSVLAKTDVVMLLVLLKCARS
jgi:quercetin dioxygenase-like cupin family protein